MAKDPFLQLDVIREASRKRQKIKDCYRLMCHPLLLEQANYNINHQINCSQKNPFEPDYSLNQNDINRLCTLLKNKAFCFVRYPQNTLQYSMQLIVIEVIYIILTHIFPSATSYILQDNNSHRHKIIQEIKNDWYQYSWCIQGSIKDTVCKKWINKCVSTMREKIDDLYFDKIIREALKITFIEYSSLQYSVGKTCNTNSLIRLVIGQYYQKVLLKISTLPHVTESKLHYTHPNQTFSSMVKIDFCFSLKCSKSEANLVFKQIQILLENEKDKTIKLSHLTDGFRFLDYQFKKNYNSSSEANMYLGIPKNELAKFISNNKYGEYITLKTSSRAELINLSEKAIIAIYNRELKKFLDYYCCIDNKHTLKRFFYLVKGSLIRTIAQKRKTSMKIIAQEIRQNKAGFFIRM
ncbi:group II intron reverse transcriptase/maturase [Saliterribacillus persicus]|uniref:Type II intron maturase n=1 Tax=Saliterribacillus persicus TaxID=930114 RepID=A0A368XEK9_9BACI|nr:group II intron reverse transcriptase/maturase [Saliterribacillus persicus]RCW66403.1 type II intron maturase [Saliterribacillus persicus]